jgi:hypothetical protein
MGHHQPFKAESCNQHLTHVAIDVDLANRRLKVSFPSVSFACSTLHTSPNPVSTHSTSHSLFISLDRGRLVQVILVCIAPMPCPGSSLGY